MTSSNKKIGTVRGTIPVNRYLKKFALHSENAQQTGIINLIDGCVIAHELAQILAGKHFERRKDYRLNADYDETLTFEINKKRFDDYQISISEFQIVSFNSYLRKLLHKELALLISINKLHGIDKKDTIIAYMEELGIDEETDRISIDGLTRANNRRQKKLKLEGFYSPKRHLIYKRLKQGL